MKKNITTILLLILVLFLTFTLIRANAIYKKNTNELKNIMYGLNTENDNFKQVIGYMYQYDGKKMRDINGIDENGTKITISNLLKNEKNALFFSYSSADCSECINEVFEKLSAADSICNIFVVSDFKSIASARYLKNKYALVNAVFVKVNDMEYIDTPSILKTDNTLIIRSFLMVTQHDKVLMPYLRQLKTVL